MTFLRISSLLLVALVIGAFGTSCGGGSGSGSSDETGSSSDGSATSEGSPADSGNQGLLEGTGAEPSKEFLGNGRNGRLAKVGTESSAAEREAASKVLETSQNARASGDWATQCETLAPILVAQIEKSGSALSSKQDCPAALEAQAASLPQAARASTMTGPIDALRINQRINGFAFYHGTEGRDFVIPLIKQGSEWKLVTLQEEEVR